MPQLSIRRTRSIILFVIFWLVVSHVVTTFAGVLNQTLRWLWGLLAALMSGALLWFVRWRAERTLGPVGKRWGYYAWYCVPTLVMLAPFAWNVVRWFARMGTPRGLLPLVGAALTALLPLLLELGVPVFLLSVVYLQLPDPPENPRTEAGE